MRRTVVVSVWLVAIVIGIIAGLVWYAVGPAAEAEHVVEPTAPITDYAMEIYSYPHVTTRLTACDGSEVLHNNDGTVAADARIETFPDSLSRRSGSPSEHWDETITVFEVVNFGARNETEKYRFRSSWKHANIKPHARGGIIGHGPESSQNAVDLSQFPAGMILRVRAELQTLESNQLFTAECTFIAG